MKKNLIKTTLFLLAFIFVNSRPATLALAREKTTFIVENFEPENNTDLRGKWETWKANDSSYCKGSLHKKIRGYKYSKILRLEYDMLSPDADSCGIFIKFNKINTNRIKYLNLHVKGVEYAGFPKSLEVELGSGNNVARETIKGIKPEWQRIAIPIELFTEQSNHLRKINSLRIILDF